MTRLFNDPAELAERTIDGFVAAHQRWVPRVPAQVTTAAQGTA